MEKNTQELILEILSEESSPSLSSLPNDSCSLPKQEDSLNNHTQGTPSPFKGEGWGEGKDPGQLSGVVVGQLRSLNDQGRPFVDFPENSDLQPIEARSTVQLEKSHLGENVVFMFENGDIRKPIIMGILYSSDKKPPEIDINEESGQTQPANVEIDGERLTFTAKKEIVLKCGKASITLTKAGKILIRGEYLLNRSSGVNRIHGGSVQIN